MINYANSPSEISLNQIDTLIKGVGGPNFNGNNISLSGSEINYMGSSSSIGNVLVSKLCMYGQQENRLNTVSIPENPTWSIFDSSPSDPPGKYFGSDIPWRPTRFSEFLYAEKPFDFIVTVQGTGSIYGGNLVLTMLGGMAPYFIYSSTDRSWAFTSSNTYTKYSYAGFTTDFYVVDGGGCGGNFEITHRGHYPGYPYGD